MLVFEYFLGDNNDDLKDLQSAMYSYSISTIFSEIKRLYLDNPFTELYLSPDEIKSFYSIENYDHRLIQGVHDHIAAVFRFQAKEGIFEKDLFEKENADIKDFFSNIYRDTDFLKIIPDRLWFLTVRWYNFILEFLVKNKPVARHIALAILVYSSNTDKNKQRWESADKAIYFIKNKYHNILWKSSKDNNLEAALIEGEDIQ
jgi:hypothetical protein